MAKRQVSIFINGKQVANQLKSIRSEKRKINAELELMTRGTEEYEAKASELRKVNKIIADHKKTISGTESAWKKISKNAKGFVALAGVAFTADVIVDYGKELFNLGVEMEVLGKKAEVVFGEALPEVTRQAKENAEAIGLTNGQYVDAAAAIGDLLIPMKFQREEAATISTELVNLSGALSEWTGGQIKAEEVSKILSKALLGEREELKQLGISISEADVKARLAEKGLEKLTGTMLQQAKAAATLELITEKSADAQAAFARNSDTLVRQQAKLRAQLQSIQEVIATALIPVFGRLVDAAASFVGVIQDYISLDVGEQLEQERTELNLLVSQITEGNINQEDRNKLIGQLQAKYPSFLGNLSAEEATNEQIAQRLKEVNNQYIFKIALQKEDDKIQKAAQRVANQQRRSAEKDLEIRSKVIRLNEKYNLDLDLTNKTLDEQRKLVASTLRELGIGLREAAGLELTGKEVIEDKLNARQEELTQLQLYREQLKQNLAAELGIDLDAPSSDPTPTITDPPVDDNEGNDDDDRAKQRAKAREKERKEVQAHLQRLEETVSRFRENARLDRLEDDERRLEEIRLLYQKQIDIALELEKQGVEAATALRKELVALQAQAIQEERFLQDEAFAEQLEGQIDAELDKVLETEAAKSEAIINEIHRRHDEEIRSTDEKNRRILEAEKQQHEDVAKVIGFSADVVSSALSLLGDEALRNTKQGKALALIQIGLKTAEGIAAAVAAGAGLVFPANLAAIGSGIAAVTTGIASARQALQATPEVPQRYTGGWLDAKGADDGKIYRAKYIGQPVTGMLPNHPVLLNSSTGQNVLASERGAEYFVSNKSLQDPVVLNYVRAIDNIQRHRQFQDGGATAPLPTPTTTPPQNIAANTSNEMMAVMQQLLSVLSQLRQNGVLAVVPDETILDITNRYDKINQASGGVL